MGGCGREGGGGRARHNTGLFAHLVFWARPRVCISPVLKRRWQHPQLGLAQPPSPRRLPPIAGRRVFTCPERKKKKKYCHRGLSHRGAGAGEAGGRGGSGGCAAGATAPSCGRGRGLAGNGRRPSAPAPRPSPAPRLHGGGAGVALP